MSRYQQDGEGGGAGEKCAEHEFLNDDSRKAKRGHGEDPETSSFQAELGKDKTCGQGGQSKGANGQVEKGKHLGFLRVGPVVIHMPKTERIQREQTKYDEELQPLAGLTDKSANVLEADCHQW